MNRQRSVLLTLMMVALVVSLVFLASGTAAFAQTARGALRGTLTDSTGAVVVGGSVTLTNDKGGVAYTATSSEAGLYRFELLEPGTYSLKIIARGFDDLTRSEIVVAAGQIASVDAQLKTDMRPVIVQITVGGGPLITPGTPHSESTPQISRQWSTRRLRPRRMLHRRHRVGHRSRLKLRLHAA